MAAREAALQVRVRELRSSNDPNARIPARLRRARRRCRASSCAWRQAQRNSGSVWRKWRRLRRRRRRAPQPSREKATCWPRRSRRSPNRPPPGLAARKRAKPRHKPRDVKPRLHKRANDLNHHPNDPHQAAGAQLGEAQKRLGEAHVELAQLGEELVVRAAISQLPPSLTSAYPRNPEHSLLTLLTGSSPNGSPTPPCVPGEERILLQLLANCTSSLSVAYS
jgi:hypothetical protein